jgi:mannosyl-oligosaccharide glucosidase
MSGVAPAPAGGGATSPSGARRRRPPPSSDLEEPLLAQRPSSTPSPSKAVGGRSGGVSGRSVVAVLAGEWERGFFLRFSFFFRIVFALSAHPPSPPSSQKKTHTALAATAALAALAAPHAALAVARLRAATLPPHLRRLPGPFLSALPQFQGAHASDLLWGTYRPGLYTGIRPRVPRGLVGGVMWFAADGAAKDDPSRPPPLRHLAEERDGLDSFGWRLHDGETGGVHTALDGRANVTTAFLKRRVDGVYGGDWALRIAVTDREAGVEGASSPPPRISALFYLADEDGPGVRWAAGNGPLAVTRAAGEGGSLPLRPGGPPILLASGRSAPVGRWALHAAVGESGDGGGGGGGGAPLSIRPARAVTAHFHNLTELAASLLEPPLEAVTAVGKHHHRKAGADAPPRPAVVELVDAAESHPHTNAAFFQVTADLPFAVDFVFSAGLDGDASAEGAWADEAVPDEGSGAPTSRLARAKAAWRAQADGRSAAVAPGFTPHPAAEPLAARVAALSGRSLTTALAAREAAFDARFEATFGSGVRAGAAGLGGGGSGGGGSAADATAALSRAALANLLGGLGFFHGRPLVRLPGPPTRSASHPSAPAAVEGPAASLFTAVPARAFFPRGFLWDEGFHHLLLARWSPAMSADALGHWLDAVSSTGWIAREQILGDEARSRVPAEFLAQDPDAANPPTLLLPLAAIARRVAEGGADAASEAAFLAAAFPRVAAWVDWFLAAQAAPSGPPGAFAWRGRDAGAARGRELNPKTLTSGLDDYPRASHPSPSDRHVDLLCWAAFAARAAAAIGSVALGSGQGTEAGPKALAAKVAAFNTTAARLGDPAHLADLHWDRESATFADFGLHTDDLALRWHILRDPRTKQPVERVLLRAPTRGGPRAGDIPAEGEDASTRPPPPADRDDDPTPPAPGFVRHFGYVSLFPVLMRLLPPDSPHLGATLAAAADPERGLLSAAGLASLSPASPFRDARNTEHDAPYWRGAAWPPINYLALAALDHYARAPGPHAAAAAALRDDVRAAFVGNVVEKATAGGGVCDVWERYTGDASGTGLGPRPFTGWGSLVVLAAAGVYFDM